MTSPPHPSTFRVKSNTWGMSETSPMFVFFNKFIGKMLNFSVKKGDYSLKS
jgi:hypothetical protein